MKFNDFFNLNTEEQRAAFMWNGLAIAFMTLMLAVDFGLKLFAIQLPASCWPFELIIIGITSPLSLVGGFLKPVFPIQLTQSFPQMPVASLMSLITHQPAAHFASHTGVIDWRSLIAIPFWQLFLILAYQSFWYLRGNMSVTDFKKAIHETAVDHDYTAAYGHPKPVRASHEAHSEAMSGPSEPSDPKLKDRLIDSRNLSQKVPQFNKLTRADWEKYKDQEGGLMVRDMIQQLRQENLNLLAQKTELKSTFSQYFSPNVLRYLEQNKNTYQDINNQEHAISVLFCDLRGFSNFTQNATNDEVVQYLSEYFEIASYCILHKYNGVISKLMGDGFMAYWGFPMANKDHAYVATLAAQTILKEVQFRNDLKPNEKPIKVGLGIATGNVIVGNIGSMDFKDFTLIGTPVNLAARLEEANKKLNTSLLISEATFEGVKDRIPCQHLGEHEIRGWQKREHIYAPESYRD